jgi:ribonucleoside-diphosphate reductase beta chain
MSNTNGQRNGNHEDQSFEAVIQTIDEGLERLPSYMDLYHKWERQQWMVQELDFAEDQRQWESEMPDVVRQQRMGGYTGFFAGEIAVTDTLAPYIAAMPRLDQRVFLTTQVVDEARHVVFFDKWFREVLGKDAKIVGDQMVEMAQHAGSFYRYIFYDLLPGISKDIGHHPNDLGLLIEGVTLYHIVIEGAMALAGQTSILQQYKLLNIFPGFQKGFTDVARDESRHVLFGVKFLYDMVQASTQHAYRIVDFINRLLPDLYEFGRPSVEFIPAILKAGRDVDFTPKFYASALRRKLRAMGIQADIPDPKPTPIPEELKALAV